MDQLPHFQTELLNTLASGGGLRELARQISAALGRGVIIINSSHRILVSTISNADVSEGKLLKIATTGPIPDQVTVFPEEQPIEVLVTELRNSVKRLGFLLICEPGLADHERLKTIAQEASLACVLELQKQEELLEQGRQYKDDFLFDLLYGNIGDPADIIMRGGFWGWNFKRPHVVLVFELQDFERYSGDPQLMEILDQIVQTVVESLNEKAIVLLKNEQVILVLPLEKKSRREKSDYINMIIQKVRAQSKEHLESRVIWVGVGKEYSNPTELFRSYQEAKVASTLGSLLQEQSHTPFFTDLGIDRILYNHDRQELEEFYQETLEPLEEYDRLQKNELMETLNKYVVNHCDLKQTADDLFLHPNTLRYRLKRIEEILEIDIKDFDTILSLIVAFKIQYLKQLSIANRH